MDIGYSCGYTIDIGVGCSNTIVTGAFYRAYLRRMIPKVNELIGMMKNNTPEGEWHPDIFILSSQVIQEMILQYYGNVEYVNQLSIEDYFGDNTVMQREIKTKVLTDFTHNKQAFKRNAKKNELIYIPGEYGYVAKRVKDALPEFLEAKISGNRLIMRLDKAVEFFGIKFKKGWF